MFLISITEGYLTVGSGRGDLDRGPMSFVGGLVEVNLLLTIGSLLVVVYF